MKELFKVALISQLIVIWSCLFIHGIFFLCDIPFYLTAYLIAEWMFIMILGIVFIYELEKKWH
jgi:hypothetical protein